jgi:hypothetical protein
MGMRSMSKDGAEGDVTNVSARMVKHLVPVIYSKLLAV